MLARDVEARPVDHEARVGAELAHLACARHVEARVGRDDAVARAELHHRLAARAPEQELMQPLAGPAQAQVAAVVDAAGLDGDVPHEGLAEHDALDRDLLRHVVAHAPEHRQHLAENDVGRHAREDLIDAGPEIHRDALGEGTARVGQEAQRRVGRLRALLDAHGEATAARERLEQVQVRIGADGDGVQAHRVGQPSHALEQPGGVELADRGRAVTDVDHGARPRGIEQRSGLGDGSPEIGRTARGLAGEAVEQGVEACGRGGAEGRVGLATERAQGQVARDDGHAVLRSEVRDQRLDHAPAELEVRAVGAGRHVGDHDQVEALLLLRGAEHVARYDDGHVEVVARVLLLGQGRRAGRTHRRVVSRAIDLELGGRRLVDELEPHVAVGLEVATPERDGGALHVGTEAGARPLRSRLRQVGREGELLHARRVATVAHRIAVEAGRTRGGTREPLGVPDHDAARGASRDRVDARTVDAGRVPLEQGRVVGGALVDLGLVGLGRLLLLAHVAVDQVAVAVHGEAL